MDLFDAQVQAEVDRRLADLVRTKPELVIQAYATENKRLLLELEHKEKQLVDAAPKIGKWIKFLDTDNHLDISEVAERIKVPYIDPNGKRKHMGLQYFCKMLRMDRILLEKSTGYGLYSDCPTTIRNNSKIVSTEYNGFIRSSVKFNAVALDYLDDKYSNDDRVWHSTTSKELYHD